LCPLRRVIRVDIKTGFLGEIDRYCSGQGVAAAEILVSDRRLTMIAQIGGQCSAISTLSLQVRNDL
jgi:hypothetical protein